MKTVDLIFDSSKAYRRPFPNSQCLEERMNSVFHVCGVVYNIGSSGDTDSLDPDLGSEVPAVSLQRKFFLFFVFFWSGHRWLVLQAVWNRMLLLFSTDVYEIIQMI